MLELHSLVTLNLFYQKRNQVELKPIVITK